ncbi:MAG TPA: GNAT family N-acetyltransferase [Candidatus Deferrimicrobium sp.]|nr:GNAT family N-acetyltransferase [Candidatus Deferrimicrobium sp.]
MVITKENKIKFRYSNPVFYHREYERQIRLNIDTLIFLRPLVPCDFKRLALLFDSFSNETLFFRYFNYNPRIKGREIKRLLQAIYQDELVLVAELSQLEQRLLIGICELVLQKDDSEAAECAITIIDTWQGKHLGIEMLKWLISLAAARDIKTLIGYYILGNLKVPAILRKSGYKYTINHYQNIIKFELFLEECE